MGLLSTLTLVLAFVGFGFGCSNAHPTLNLPLSSSGFSVDQHSISVTSKTSLSFFVSGRCSVLYNDVRFSFDNGSTWTSLKTLDPASTVDCSNTGVFSGNILNPSGYSASNFTGSSFSVLAQATSSLGSNSDPATVLLTYLGKSSVGSLASASTGGFVLSGSSNYYLRGHVQAQPASQVGITSTSGNFQIVGALSAY